MNNEIKKMLEKIEEAAREGKNIKIEIAIEAEQDFEKEEVENNNEDTSKMTEEKMDDLALDFAVATVCMTRAKELSEWLESIYKYEGQRGLNSANDVFDYCAKDKQVRLEVIVK